MLCEQCQKRPATVHVTKIQNNKKTELNLCHVCAHESGELAIGFEPNVLHNFLTNFFKSGQGEAGAQRWHNQPRCTGCGFTLNQFSQIGRLGCPLCYESFSDYLAPMIRKIHGAEIHTGKIPSRIGGTIKLRKKLDQLRNQLQKVIAREEFEKAAQLRDEIKRLEKEFGREVQGDEIKGDNQ